MAKKTDVGPHYDGGGKSFLTTELLERDNLWTPDFLELKKLSYHVVFVYGTLKSGGRLHEYLDGCPCLGDAYIATPSLVMREAKGFPVAFVADENDRRNHQAAHVYGELYVVPAHVILELDKLEDNGNMFDRELRYVFCVDQKYSTNKGAKNVAIKAMTYLGNKEYWDGIPLGKLAQKKSGEKYFYEYDQLGSRIDAMISHLTK